MHAGDVREIVGQPVFVPLYKLFLTYGKIFRLSFGPKSFVVISDAGMAKQVRVICSRDVETAQQPSMVWMPYVLTAHAL